jgi:hypothetical protein
MAPAPPHALASLYHGRAGNIARHAGIWGHMKDCREGDASFAAQPCKLCVAGTRNNRYFMRSRGYAPPREGLPLTGALEGKMLVSSYVNGFSVSAAPSPDGGHIVCKLDNSFGVTLIMDYSEAAALRDALTEALLSIPEGQR